MEKAKVLVLSNDHEFLAAMARSWQRLRYSPELAVAAAGELVRAAVVVTDDVSRLKHLAAGVVLAIVVTPETAPPLDEPDGPVSVARTRVLWMQRGARWSDLAAALAQETALRLDAERQAAEARQRLCDAERYAALGRFIAEARHGLGNALTGVLGHSELLLLETGKGIEGETRAQVETIHQMTLKIQETFRRLSALDMEMRILEQQTQETQCRPVQ